MRHRRIALRGGMLAAAMALVLPALAAAHPNIYRAGIRVAFTPEIQTLTLANDASPATVDGSTIADDGTATATDVENILNADSHLGYDGVAVTGATGGPFTLTFQGYVYSPAVAVTDTTHVGADAQAGLDVDQIAATGGAAVTTTQQGGTAVTGTSDPTGLTMAQKANTYVVANDGYVLGISETNGVGPAADFATSNAGGGMVALASGLSDRKTYASKADWLSVPSAETSIQLHATCQGVAALTDTTNILAAWGVANIDNPSAGGTDPFYDYIPWQGTDVVAALNLQDAAFNDEASLWLSEIDTLYPSLGLTASSTTDQWKSACTTIGGTYTPADTVTSLTTALGPALTDPLNTQITTLQGTDNSLTAQVGQLQSKLASYAQTPAVEPFTLTVAGGRIAWAAPVALVTGTATNRATVTVTVTKAVAKALKSKTILASGTGRIGTTGALLLVLKPAQGATKALAHHKGALRVTVTARIADKSIKRAARLS